MLKIRKSVYQQMLVQAKKELPNEACGYVAGLTEGITRCYPLTNTDASPEHFSMDPKEQLAAVKDMRAAGLELLGCYHSHPSTPARPSDEDIRLAYDPRMVYIIISLQEAKEDMKAYRIRGVDVERVELEFVD